MSAPKENTYWQQRRTHGRKPKFQTPEEFQQAWFDYLEWVDAHPWQINEPIKSGDKSGTLMQVPAKRPYTESGFCAFHGLGKNFINKLEKRLKTAQDEDNGGVIEVLTWSEVLNWAREVLWIDKFEGAVVGAYNANIISRELGLKEATEVTINKVGKDLADEVYE